MTTKLVRRAEEYSEEFGKNLIFGYFDQLPTPEEAATVYFQGSLPKDWASYPECAVLADGFNIQPQKVGDSWRILLGEFC